MEPQPMMGIFIALPFFFGDLVRASERLIDQVGAATRAAAGSLVTKPGTAIPVGSGPWRRVPGSAETLFRRPAAGAPGCAPRRRRRNPGQARRSRDDGM